MAIYPNNAPRPRDSNEFFIPKTNGNKNSEQSNKKQIKNNQARDKFAEQYKRQIKVLSIFLFLISILLLIALVSYTSKDEAYAEIGFSDILALIRGDQAMYEKASATQNWLGIIGAIISNFLYNSTIGYAIILLPLIIALWGKHLFQNLTPSETLIKRTILFLIIGTLFATLMGTISHIQWLSPLPKEWSGVLGQFLASFLCSLLGTIGTILLIITLILIVSIIAFNINIDKYLEKIKIYFKKIVLFFRSLFKKTNKTQTNETYIEKETFQEEDNKHHNIDDTADNDDDIEPAKIIQKNIAIQKDKSKIGNLNITINPYKDTDITDTEKRKSTDFGSNIIHKLIDDDNHKVEDNSNEELNESEFDYEYPDIPETKPLTVTINEIQTEETPYYPISTAIHNEKISYTMPSLDMLDPDESSEFINEEELQENANILQEKLATFKIYIENLSITPGPVVTQYEFVPAAGIKISRIEALADDIAMALKAKGIRIIAPIPGKGTVGIEIPNQNPSIVRFSSVVRSPKFTQTNYKLPIVFGKTISGDVYCTDLTKMPHLLIAGATGSGKSVGINTIICSLLYKLHPSRLKFVIIDPKKVELKQYSRLENHFLAVSPDLDSTIITDPQEAVIVLKAICAEMDLRYDILASVGQRNIFEYNLKVNEGKFSKEKEMSHLPMPYIIVIIDELADLMLTASKEVEQPIIRLAQLARAVGIHLVVATQRPSVDVITGIIKANFPARISYLVASKVDSRTVLDISGAEQLLGNGDMLFNSGGSSKPLRIQNAYITSDEVERICDFIGDQQGYSQPYLLPSLNDTTKQKIISKEDRDPLFEEAARLFISHQQASVSLLQRRFKIGYARAGRIVDELEAAGVVGPSDGSKARQVYMESESELEAIL